MLTIAETTEFSALWPDYWTAEEFGEFCAWLALNPESGSVVPQSDGLPQGAMVDGWHWQERRRAGDLLQPPR